MSAAILNPFQRVAAMPRGVPNSHTPPKKRGPKSTKGTGLLLDAKGLRTVTLAPRPSLIQIVPRLQAQSDSDRRRAISKLGTK